MKTSSSALAVLCSVFIFTAPAEAQTFSRTYQGPALQGARLDKVQEAPDGGLAALGFMDGPQVILSLDRHGNVRWCRSLEREFAAGDIAVSPVDGHILVVGSYGGVGVASAMLLDQGTGSLRWAKSYAVDFSHLSSALANADGTFVLGGGLSITKSYDFWILKIDSQGDLLWDRAIGEPLGIGSDLVWNITGTRDGYAIVGSMMLVAGDPDICLFQLDEDGTLIHGLFLHDTFGVDGLPSVAELASGDLVIAAENHLSTMIVGCYSTNGLLNWEVEFSNGGDFPKSIVATPDGGCVIASATGTVGGKLDALLTKLDANGVPLWQKQYSGGSRDFLLGMTATADGGFAMVGTTDSFQNTSQAWLLKVDSTGITSPCCPLDRDVHYPPQDPTTQIKFPSFQYREDLGRTVDISPSSQLMTPVESVQCATNSGPWTDLGSGLAGSLGVPCYAGVGSLQANSFVTSLLSGARPFSLAFLIIGFSELNADVKDGTLVPAPDLIFVLSTNLAGGVNLPGTWPPGLPSGFPLYLQYFIQDPAGPEGFSISNAIRAITP